MSTPLVFPLGQQGRITEWTEGRAAEWRQISRRLPPMYLGDETCLGCSVPTENFDPIWHLDGEDREEWGLDGGDREE